MGGSRGDGDVSGGLRFMGRRWRSWLAWVGGGPCIRQLFHPMRFFIPKYESIRSFILAVASGLKSRRSESDFTDECVPNEQSHATLASSPEEDYTGTEKLDTEKFDMNEDSDPDAGEGVHFSTEEDVDFSTEEDVDFSTEEDVDSDIEEKFGSDTDGNVWDLDRLWEYGENVLQVLSNAYEKKPNSYEAKRREESAIKSARTKVSRLDLYSRLMTELQKFHEPDAETAPDYIKQGVSGLWRENVILIEDANGNVLGLSPPDVLESHCVFYGRKSSAGVSAGGCPWYEFKIWHEVRKGMLAGKNMIFWYDQDMKCMKKWPHHRWCRIPNAQVEFLEAGLLNAPQEWSKIIGYGGNGRTVREAVAFDGSKVAIKIMAIVEDKKDVSERRFLEQEARLLYTLENRYLISCYATFVIENVDRTVLHLVMERAEGTLQTYLDDDFYKLRYLEENEIWLIFIEILLGLHFLHTNEHRILHRDISLCNILRVLQKGEDGKPDSFIHKLSDLGVARVRRAQTESSKSSHFGKEMNFAPEQHQRGSYTEKTDVFQIGLVVHHCCNRRHPYANQFEKSWKNRRIERINSRYSDELDNVITSCLSLSPDSRPNTLEFLANPIIRKKAKEIGITLPDPVAIVGLIKLDFEKEEIVVFNKGKLQLEYPPRYFMPAAIRKAFSFPPVEMDKSVEFGDTSYIFHDNMSRMFIQFKCVCVSNAHDWNLQLTLRHLSSIANFTSIDGHWWSPINIYLNERIVSWEFQPEYWRDYCESVFELPSDLVNWDGKVNVLQIQLSEVVATTKYWLQGCKLEIQRIMLHVEDHKAVTNEDAKCEFIWVVTTSLSKITAITCFLSLCAYGYLPSWIDHRF